MTRADDLYASPTSDLEHARKLLEERLQIAFAMHDSAWRGGDYFMATGSDGETYILQRNVIANSEPAVEEFRDIDTILHVEWTNRSAELLETLQALGFRRLRHKEA